VACPAELLKITGCERNDEKTLFGAAAVATNAASSFAAVSAYYFLAVLSVLAVLVPPLFV
jgi:hypothetical protein